MQITTSNRRIPSFYIWATRLALIAIAFLPLFAVVTGSDISARALLRAALWAAIVVGMIFYARHRCSSQNMTFLNGLYYVTAAMSVWGASGIFLLIIPSLFIVLIVSFSIAFFNDLRGKAALSPPAYYRLIGMIYKNRLNR